MPPPSSSLRFRSLPGSNPHRTVAVLSWSRLMIPAERRQPDEFGVPFDAPGKVLLADEFLGEEVHEQAIMERAVRAELVASHHTDRPEADLLVRADGRDVVGSRIDYEPVVAQIINEVAGQ